MKYRSKMLPALLMMLATALLATPALAQRAKAAKPTDVIRHALEQVTTLDEDQKSKSREILADADAQAAALRDDAKAARPDGDKKEHRAAVVQLVSQTREQVEALLNDEQKATFRKAFAEARQKAKQDREEKREKEPKKPKKAKR